MPPKVKKIDPELQKVLYSFNVGAIRGVEGEGRV